jgi:hypothetical protein
VCDRLTCVTFHLRGSSEKIRATRGFEPTLAVIGSVIPEISTGSFRRILGSPFQTRPNDPIECLGIAEVIFLCEIKLFGPFRPISGIVSGTKKGSAVFSELCVDVLQLSSRAEGRDR